MSLSATVFDIGGASEKFDYSATSVSSTILPDGTEAVRLVATTDVCVSITNSSAVSASTTTSMFIPQFAIEYVKAKGGQFVAAIRDSADGSLKVTPLRRN